VLPARRGERRDRGGQRQVVGAPGVDPAQHRIDQPVGHGPAQPLPHQPADRDIGTRREQRPVGRPALGGRVGGDAEQRAGRDRLQPGVERDRGAAHPRPDQPRVEAEVAHQHGGRTRLAGLRIAHRERLGTRLHRLTRGQGRRAQLAADHRSLLHQEHLGA
jgi:hypothetical protein